MKQILLILNIFLIFSFALWAAPIRNHPTTITQPDGSKIHCFSSGDEYFNYLHDAKGYTLILGDDGYCYYATLNTEQELIPSSIRAGNSFSSKSGIQAYTLPSKAWYEEKRERYELLPGKKPKTKIVSTGTIYGLVIFIRFADDPEFTESDLKRHCNHYNSLTGSSMRNFYERVSYGKLSVENHYFPNPSSSTMGFSYTDNHKRGYFLKYNATLNPIGYQNETERSNREWNLLKVATEWVAKNCTFPEDVNFDSDNDGYADFVSYIIQGKSKGWNDLLWAHKWQFSSSMEPNITSNIRIGTYTFLPEDQTATAIICHESFHAFGAPDLYHYQSHQNLNPCGEWDIMDGGNGHMTSFMKKRYTSWKKSQEITQSGTYVLYPHAETNDQSLYEYKYNDNESLFFEFRRRNSDLYEAQLPGDGLIIIRADHRFDGNALFNGYSTFDGVYIFRPGGSPLENGQPLQAHFSTKVGRSYFGHDSVQAGLHCTPFASNGDDIPVEINNVIDHGDSLTFNIILLDKIPVEEVKYFHAQRKEHTIALRWEMAEGQKEVIIAKNTLKEVGSLIDKKNYKIGDLLPCGSTIVYIGNKNKDEYEYPLQQKEESLYFKAFSSARSRYSSGIPKESYKNFRHRILDNRLRSDSQMQLTLWPSPSWGSVVGHNSKGHRSFLERFDIAERGKTLISGIALDIEKAHISGENPSKIHLQLFGVNLEKLPAELIYQQEVSMGQLKKDLNYLFFDSIICVDQSFFAGVSITYSNPLDTLYIRSTSSNPAREKRYVVYTGSQYTYLNTLAPITISSGIFPLIKDLSYLRIEEDSLHISSNSDAFLHVSTPDGGDFDLLLPPSSWLEAEKIESIGQIRLYDKSTAEERNAETIYVKREGGLIDSCRIIRKESSQTINPQTKEKNLQIYPNPAQEWIKVHTPAEKGTLCLLDLQGRSLRKVPISSPWTELSLEGISSGIYLLKSIHDSLIQTHKIIKK